MSFKLSRGLIQQTTAPHYHALRFYIYQCLLNLSFPFQRLYYIALQNTTSQSTWIVPVEPKR
jgi:hypothetical protein